MSGPGIDHASSGGLRRDAAAPAAKCSGTGNVETGVAGGFERHQKFRPDRAVPSSSGLIEASAFLCGQRCNLRAQMIEFVTKARGQADQVIGWHGARLRQRPDHR